jgi:alpha-N-arabinofuranosidase
MKRILLFIVLFVTTISLHPQDLKARIKIDIERTIGAIDTLIYGNFTEHLGRCIYGGIYDPQSSKANADGFRKDVIDATNNLGVSIIRYPGGNFVSGYHWEDGIGPVANRPKRKDLAWGAIESNVVGTDEFMKFIKKTKAAPYMCVNLGTGTIEEARNWVEYCNAPAGLYYSDLRVKNGHPLPYNIKYWGLGNEMDGTWQMGHKNAEDYSKYALEAAKLMKWSDENIKLIASGSSNYGADWMHWNRTVLTQLRNHIDYISVHQYVNNSDSNHKKFMTATLFTERIIKSTEALINEVKSRYRISRPIYIAFDEYNVWYRAWTEQQLEEHYNLQDALVIAEFMNCFIRNAHIVKMANMAQLVNVIAPMMVTKDKLWLQTIYYPLQLFGVNCYGQSVSAFVDGDTYDVGDQKGIPYIDVSTVYNTAKEELIINVVNRSEDKAVETTVQNQFGMLAARGVVSELNSKNIYDENNVNEQKVKTINKQITLKGNEFTYSFPAHSFTQIIIKIKK